MKGPLAAVLLVLILALLPGCSLLRAPQKVVSAVVPVPVSNKADPVELQAQLQRFADDFTTKTVQALDDYAQRTGTDAARLQALHLKLLAGSAVIGVASGPNPNANLLDMVSIATLSRMTVEDYWVKTTNGFAFQQWLDASRSLETNVWELAGRVLKPPQLTELYSAITNWYAQNPKLLTGFYARPQEFAPMVKPTKEKEEDVNSVFGLVGLDPTAGIDPAVREVTRTRLFAERALYAFQRMPFAVRLQTELLAYQLTGQSAVQQSLTNLHRLSESVERVSRAAETFSQTAAQLPDRVSNERKEILAALDSQEGKLRELAADLNCSLQSGEKMSSSLNTTLTTFDGLMKRFGVGEERPKPASSTNSRPFNILEYGQVAGQLGAMAQDFNALVNSVDKSVPQVDRLSRQAVGEARQVVDRAFLLSVVLIVVLLAGSVAAGLTYKAMASRLTRGRLDSTKIDFPEQTR